MPSEQEVVEIKRRHSAQLLQQPGVCGAGVEKDDAGNFYLAVHLDATNSRAGENVLDSIEGASVKRIRSGPFVKQ